MVEINAMTQIIKFIFIGSIGMLLHHFRLGFLELHRCFSKDLLFPDEGQQKKVDYWILKNTIYIIFTHLKITEKTKLLKLVKYDTSNKLILIISFNSIKK